jgi:hypothetical protein
MQLRFATLTLLAAASVALPSAEQRTGRERGILVGAALSSGAPVTDLTATDFVVREDGIAREVIRADAAPPPSHIMLLVDDSQAMQASVPFVRSGVANFIRRFRAATPAPQMALMTFGERPTKRADFAATAAAMDQAASRIFSIPGSGSYFLQALRDACQDLRKRAAPSPVIVAFVDEASPEFSTDTRKQIAAALQSAGASLWVIVRQDTANADRSPEGHERAAVLGDETVASGGMTRTILSPQSIEPAFEGVASLLASRYLVVYGRPDQTIPPASIEVTSKRPDVRIIATRRAR